ncbi:GTPase-associated system all-helical protein GASH [Leptospira borgpetersenii]|uniref:GTPase-associated system all-helical protein GASH n=1 Tax=Leptospira borgpetersenii TaxID=174 RepID=UPI000773085F|nr:GTPase-associated system all-helical protein GASH [Leptospira borgpetersenii]
MKELNLADLYKLAGLNPGPEIINLRKDSFDKILSELNNAKIIQLVRMYFGFPATSDFDWFRNGFAEMDSSFTLIENQNEATVLAAALLRSAMDKFPLTSLALVCGSVGGIRKTKIQISLLEEAKQALQMHSIKKREKLDIDLKIIKPSGKSKFPTSIDAMPNASDWPKFVESLKLLNSESAEANRVLGVQVSGILQLLITEGIFLKEEINILWWHIGGYSSILENPYSELSINLGIPLAGLELADLSQSLTGPVSAPALLHRTLLGIKKVKPTKKTTSTKETVSIKEIVNEFPMEKYSKLGLNDIIKNYPELCPVLYGFYKCFEIGDQTAWGTSYKRDTHLDSQSSLAPLDLAIQVYRERLILRELSKNV